MGIGSAENEETVSTMNITSGYLRTTPLISSIGFITPVEVSLWIKASASNWAVRSWLSISSGSIALPHGTWRGAAILPQRFDTSNHLSEKAPHMQFSTPLFTRLRTDPSMTPHAEEVERKTGCCV